MRPPVRFTSRSGVVALAALVAVLVLGATVLAMSALARQQARAALRHRGWQAARLDATLVADSLAATGGCVPESGAATAPALLLVGASAERRWERALTPGGGCRLAVVVRMLGSEELPIAAHRAVRRTPLVPSITP